QIFKFIFPAIFSLVPIVIYKVYRKFMTAQMSFLAVFLIVSYFSFYQELIQLARQEVAELLLGLLLLIPLIASVSQSAEGKILMMLFTVGLIVSHYSIAYIYLLIAGFSIIMSRISKQSSSISSLTV